MHARGGAAACYPCSMPSRDPYAPPPMLPRQWLPLNPGTIVGTPASLRAPNPFSINFPKAQFANPSFVGSSIRYVPQKPVPASERVGAGPMHWSWSQFGNGKKNLPRFTGNPKQKPPRVLYSGPDLGASDDVLPKGGGTLLPFLLGALTLAAFVIVADRTLSPSR